MITHDVEQGSPEWFALRLGIPTATDFSDIVTAAKGDLAAAHDKLINRLIDELARPQMQELFAGNRHTERGKELEPDARNLYRLLGKGELRQVGFITRDDGRAGCSPDSLVDCHTDSPGGLEIKCPDGHTHVGYLRAGTLPNDYRQQVHGSMVISGRKWWDFMSYCPGYRPLIVRVHWNEYTDKVAAGLEQFLSVLETEKAKILSPEEIA